MPKTSFPTIPSSEITSEEKFINRRDFIQKTSQGLLASSAALILPSAMADSEFNLKHEITSYKDITTYNNFYELGTSKSDPSKNAKWLKPHPWSIEVSGLVNKPGKIDIEDILKIPTEERVYRMRCVERWSMVIPWEGFELNKLLQKFEPKAEAKYVEFKTILDPENLYGQRFPVLQWPYVEGLRMDEAMHPLTLMATGIYGKKLLPQNGAPIRLVIPWKYGFKGIKSIQKIRLLDREPRTSWNKAAPNEYGFYANVNPKVHHPRWRQNKERRIGEFRRRKTLLFNGYQEQVASLYKDMDLKKYF
jgi:sulfoxide reductase catalytic subunit YedY